MQLRWVAFLSALAFAVPALSSDWHQWGGPSRNFHAEARALPASWPEGGPRVLWRRPLGEGYSSIVVDGDSLYTMYRVDDDEIVVALSA